MEWPNGDPCSRPDGAWRSPFAATGATAAEQADLGHVGPNGWQLDTLIDLLRDLRLAGENCFAFWARGQQLVEGAIRIGCSVRPTPGRLLRGGRSVAGAGRSCFWPCDGGFDELPGIFGGRLSSLSRASSAAIRASCAAIWASWAAIRLSASASRAVSAAISASFSRWLSWAGAGSSGTRCVELTRP